MLLHAIPDQRHLAKAMGDYTNSEKCLGMALQEQHKQQNFEAKTFP